MVTPGADSFNNEQWADSRPDIAVQSHQSDDEESEHSREREGGIAGLPSESHHSSLHFGSHGLTLDRTDPETPLLGGNHHTVQFHPATSVLKTPLPLM